MIVRIFCVSEIIPHDIIIPLDSTRVPVAVLVDHISSALDPVFCPETEQQIPSTIHERAQLGESDKSPAARDDNICYRWGIWHTIFFS